MKKKSILCGMLTIMMVALLSIGFMSCSGEEDISVPSPSVIDSNGVLYKVTSFGDMRYSYDEIGKLIQIKYRGDVFDFSDGAIVFKSTYSYDLTTSTVSLNGKGLVSSISSEYYEGTESDYEKGTEKTACQYDSDGRLLSWTQKDNIKWVEDGESGSGYFDVKVVLKWENGKLLKITQEYSGEEDGYKESGVEEVKFTYGSQPNPARQWLYIMGEDLFELGVCDYIKCLAPLGLFGHGPVVLPISYTRTSKNNNTTTRELSYIMNENGTIRSDNGKSYTYEGETRAELVPWAPEQNKTKSKSLRSRLRRNIDNR